VHNHWVCNHGNAAFEYKLHMLTLYEACGNVVVKAVCYKQEGRGFETR
jgi:hypothetical protein